MKFASGPEADEPHTWGDVFALMRLLAAELEPPYHLLYVLLVPREEQRDGRYESESALTSEELADFSTAMASSSSKTGSMRFGSSRSQANWYSRRTTSFMRTDRPTHSGALLLRRDCAEKPFGIPAPHAHHYHRQFDPVIRDLFAHYSWIRHPLQDTDEET